MYIFEPSSSIAATYNQPGTAFGSGGGAIDDSCWLLLGESCNRAGRVRGVRCRLRTEMLRRCVLFSLLLRSRGVASAGLVEVERWGQYEANFTGPSAGNPFLDVELSATFTLVAESSPPPAAAVQPVALVRLDFATGDMGINGTVDNVGSSKTRYPKAQAVSVGRSSLVPAGCGGKSMDFGGNTGEDPEDPAIRYVVEMPGWKKNFEGLQGLKAFTITGWIQVTGSDEGAGGNRVVNWCNGAQGNFSI